MSIWRAAPSYVSPSCDEFEWKNLNDVLFNCSEMHLELAWMDEDDAWTFVRNTLKKFAFTCDYRLITCVTSHHLEMLEKLHEEKEEKVPIVSRKNNTTINIVIPFTNLTREWVAQEHLHSFHLQCSQVETQDLLDCTSLCRDACVIIRSYFATSPTLRATLEKQPTPPEVDTFAHFDSACFLIQANTVGKTFQIPEADLLFAPNHNCEILVSIFNTKTRQMLPFDVNTRLHCYQRGGLFAGGMSSFASAQKNYLVRRTQQHEEIDYHRRNMPYRLTEREHVHFNTPNFVYSNTNFLEISIDFGLKGFNTFPPHEKLILVVAWSHLTNFSMPF